MSLLIHQTRNKRPKHTISDNVPRKSTKEYLISKEKNGIFADFFSSFYVYNSPIMDDSLSIMQLNYWIQQNRQIITTQMTDKI